MVTNSTEEAKHLADSYLHQDSFTFPVLPWSLGLTVCHYGLETEGECGPTTTQVFLQCSLGEACRQPKPRSVRLTVAVATGAWWGEPDSPVLGIVP